MKHIFLVSAALLPFAAHAQPAPQPFCMPPATAQSVAAALGAGQAAMALMQEAAQEPQRQAAAVAAAVAKQKADDEVAKPAVAAPK